jgi:ABC-type transport system involved in multi-copper enzyme maturation permease subunit
VIDTIKAEFRKLLSVRSTYFNLIICLLIVALFAGYGEGVKANPKDLLSPTILMEQSTSAVVFVGLILAFVGLLLAGHEYRYNTIGYTLTGANRRWKVMASKFIVISVFAIVASLIMAFFSPLCTIIGAHIVGHPIGPQVFDIWSVVWRCAFTGWGYAMYALILILIMRNQVGAIVTFLLVPLIGENILMQLFKHIGQNLPFTALQGVAQPTGLGNHTTSGHEALIVLVYVAVGLAISSILFIRRDAN